MVTSEKSYKTAAYVAHRLGVTKETVYDMAQRGQIPVAFRLGPRLRFDIDEVEAALRGEKTR